MVDWDGKERRSGNERRTVERRQRSESRRGLYAKSSDSEKKRKDRRQWVRRGTDRIMLQLKELFPRLQLPTIKAGRIHIETDWQM